MSWSILIDGKPIKTETVTIVKSVNQGTLGALATIEFVVPDIGTSDSIALGEVGPKTLTVTANISGKRYVHLLVVPMLCSLIGSSGLQRMYQ